MCRKLLSEYVSYQLQIHSSSTIQARSSYLHDLERGILTGARHPCILIGKVHQSWNWRRKESWPRANKCRALWDLNCTVPCGKQGESLLLGSIYISLRPEQQRTGNLQFSLCPSLRARKSQNCSFASMHVHCALRKVNSSVPLHSKQLFHTATSHLNTFLEQNTVKKEKNHEHSHNAVTYKI